MLRKISVWAAIICMIAIFASCSRDAGNSDSGIAKIIPGKWEVISDAVIVEFQENGAWEDDSGSKGKWTLSGDKIELKIDSALTYEETVTGRIDENGQLHQDDIEGGTAVRGNVTEFEMDGGYENYALQFTVENKEGAWLMTHEGEGVLRKQ